MDLPDRMGLLQRPVLVRGKYANPCIPIEKRKENDTQYLSRGSPNQYRPHVCHQRFGSHFALEQDVLVRILGN
jgi:hypothetical protein